MSLVNPSQGINQRWLYSTPFSFNGSYETTKSETYTFNANGTYTLTTYATNAYGQTTSTPIDVVVSGINVLDAPRFTGLTVTGTTYYGSTNALIARWTQDGSNTLSYSVQWSRPATVSDPVYITGLTNLTITSGTSYSATTTNGAGDFTLGTYRNTTAVDNATITISRNPASSGHLTKAQGQGWISTSYAVTMNVSGLTGYYRTNRRNCTLGINNTSAILNNSSETLTKLTDTDTPNSPAIGLVELIRYDGDFSSAVISPAAPSATLQWIHAISDELGRVSFRYIASDFSEKQYTAQTFPNTTLWFAVCGYNITFVTFGWYGFSGQSCIGSSDNPEDPDASIIALA